MKKTRLSGILSFFKEGKVKLSTKIIHLRDFGG